MAKKKKAIIIGSGIGGSGIGLLLQHSGEYDVELFERNNLIGGRFASYNKEGFRIDIGCHMIANYDKGNMGKILNIAGRPEAVQWGYAHNPDPVFGYKGQRLKFPDEIYKMGFNDEELMKIMTFLAESHAIPPEKLDEYDSVNMIEYMDRYLTDKRARAIFGLMAGICFVIPDNMTPVAEWVRCNAEMAVNQTTGYPIGGTGAIPEAYARIMQELGGKLYLTKAIKRIIVENGAAKGVELKDGSIHECDIVISNAGVKPTVNDLVGRKYYGKSLLYRVDSYVYSNPTFQLKIALDTPYIQNETMVLFVNSDEPFTLNKQERIKDIPEVATHGMIPVISNIDKTSAPEGRQLVLIGGKANYYPKDAPAGDWLKWKQAYLNALEQYFPGVTGHILWMDMATPADIDNLFGEDGNVIGIAQSVGQVGNMRPSMQDEEINNLYHCSADTGLHGIGGELAADSALRLYNMLCG